MNCAVGHRHGSDLALLWLWCRPAATSPIQPLAWKPSYSMGAAIKKPKEGVFFFYFCEKYLWDFGRDSIESVDALGQYHHFNSSSNVWAWFIFSFIYIFSLFQQESLFSIYRSFTSLVKYIPGHFILFVVIVNRIFFFGLFRAAPAAYGGSQARRLIGAVAADLHHSHSNVGSELRL